MQIEFSNDTRYYAKAALYSAGDKIKYTIFKDALQLWIPQDEIELSVCDVGINISSDSDEATLAYSSGMRQPRKKGSYWYIPFGTDEMVTFQVVAPDINNMFSFVDENRITKVTGYMREVMHARPVELRRGHTCRGFNAASFFCREGHIKGPYLKMMQNTDLWRCAADDDS